MKLGVEGARRDLWVTLGMAVSAVSAGFSSFSGLRSLAEATGWTAMAPLFALCIDAYALTAIRVWLTGTIRVRALARWNAIFAIALSLAGNAAWHLIAAGLLPVTWHVVLVVGGVPPIILGLVTHLAILRRMPPDGRDNAESASSETGLGPDRGDLGTVPTLVGRDSVPNSVDASSERRYATEDELLSAARTADSAHRSRTGRPISRDTLRRELRIGGTRATQVLRRLREKGEPHG